jgi:hypothetical protein
MRVLITCLSGRINYLHDALNGKPKATSPGPLTGAVAFGLPFNEFMRFCARSWRGIHGRVRLDKRRTRARRSFGTG